MARSAPASETLHVEREPFDVEEYETRQTGLVRFDTQLALNGLVLCSAMMLLENRTQAVRINGRVGVRREGAGGAYLVGFTPTDEDLIDGPALKVVSRDGIWRPYKQVVVVNGSARVVQGYFADKADDHPTSSDTRTQIFKAA